MLRIAGQKARKLGQRIVFAEQDMRHLAVPRSVDCVVCACDGVNYLTEAADRAAFFAAYALEPFDQVRKKFCSVPPLPVRAASKMLSPEAKAKLRKKLH